VSQIVEPGNIHLQRTAVDDRLWLVSIMHYNLGHLDDNAFRQ
jgi:hypothetical protein